MIAPRSLARLSLAVMSLLISQTAAAIERPCCSDPSESGVVCCIEPGEDGDVTVCYSAAEWAAETRARRDRARAARWGIETTLEWGRHQNELVEYTRVCSAFHRRLNDLAAQQ